MFILIGRLHGNNWKNLSKFINNKIIELESTKALIKINNQINILQQKLSQYNKRFDTDFFID